MLIRKERQGPGMRLRMVGHLTALPRRVLLENFQLGFTKDRILGKRTDGLRHSGLWDMQGTQGATGGLLEGRETTGTCRTVGTGTLSGYCEGQAGRLSSEAQGT